MDPATTAALTSAIWIVVSGIVKYFRGLKADAKVEGKNEGEVVISGYRALVESLQGEIRVLTEERGRDRERARVLAERVTICENDREVLHDQVQTLRRRIDSGGTPATDADDAGRD